MMMREKAPGRSAARPTRVALLEGGEEALVGLVVVEAARDVAVDDVAVLERLLLGQVLPRGDDRFVHLVPEVVVVHLRAGDTHDRELAGQLVASRERGERGVELAVGEVTGRTEHDERGRQRDALAVRIRHVPLRSCPFRCGTAARCRGGSSPVHAMSRVASRR
jgi:hypothetical protein